MKNFIFLYFALAITCQFAFCLDWTTLTDSTDFTGSSTSPQTVSLSTNLNNQGVGSATYSFSLWLQTTSWTTSPSLPRVILRFYSSTADQVQGSRHILIKYNRNGDQNISPFYVGYTTDWAGSYTQGDGKQTTYIPATAWTFVMVSINQTSNTVNTWQIYYDAMANMKSGNYSWQTPSDQASVTSSAMITYGGDSGSFGAYTNCGCVIRKLRFYPTTFLADGTLISPLMYDEPRGIFFTSFTYFQSNTEQNIPLYSPYNLDSSNGFIATPGTNDNVEAEDPTLANFVLNCQGQSVFTIQIPTLADGWLTTSFWLMLQSGTNSKDTILSRRSSESGKPIKYEFYYNRAIGAFQLYKVSLQTSTTTFAASNLNINEWYHIILSENRLNIDYLSNSGIMIEVNLYINGALFDTQQLNFLGGMLATQSDGFYQLCTSETPGETNIQLKSFSLFGAGPAPYYNSSLPSCKLMFNYNQNSAACLYCNSGFLNDNFACMTKCPSGSRTNTALRTCDRCPATYVESSVSPGVCTLCGNGKRDLGEDCDNTILINGCSTSCTVEPGWSCSDASGTDVCTPICGDGLRVGTETCDDGNTDAGDGCSSTCEVENGYYCLGGSATSKDECSLCDEECILCTGPGPKACSTCSGGKYLYNTDCVTTCPDTTFPFNGIVCKACATNCLTCTDAAPTSCSQCIADTAFDSQKNCVPYSDGSCGIGYFKNHQSDTCDACSQNCAYCYKANSCLGCLPNNYLLNGACYASCPSEEYFESWIATNFSSNVSICVSSAEQVIYIQPTADPQEVRLYFVNSSAEIVNNAGKTCQFFLNGEALDTSSSTFTVESSQQVTMHLGVAAYHPPNSDFSVKLSLPRSGSASKTTQASAGILEYYPFSSSEFQGLKGLAISIDVLGILTSVLFILHQVKSTGSSAILRVLFVTEMLQYYKFINISYPPSLLTFWRFAYMNPIALGLPVKMGLVSSWMSSDELNFLKDGSKFEIYDIRPYFLEQYSGNLFTIILLLVLQGAIRFSIANQKCLPQKIAAILPVLRKFLAWNFFVIVLLSYNTKTVAFAILNFMHPEFGTNFGRASFIFAIVALAAPLLSTILLVIHLRRAHKERKQHLGEPIPHDHGWRALFEDYRLNFFTQFAFIWILILRTTIFGIVIVTAKNSPVAQCVIFFILSFAFLVYMVLHEPTKEKFGYRLTLFVEGAFFLFTIFICVFLSFDKGVGSPSVNARNRMGWFLVILQLAIHGVIFLASAKYFRDAFWPARPKKEVPALNVSTVHIKRTDSSSIISAADTSRIGLNESKGIEELNIRNKKKPPTKPESECKSPPSKKSKAAQDELSDIKIHTTTSKKNSPAPTRSVSQDLPLIHAKDTKLTEQTEKLTIEGVETARVILDTEFNAQATIDLPTEKTQPSERKPHQPASNEKATKLLPSVYDFLSKGKEKPSTVSGQYGNNGRPGQLPSLSNRTNSEVEISKQEQLKRQASALKVDSAILRKESAARILRASAESLHAGTPQQLFTQSQVQKVSILEDNRALSRSGVNPDRNYAKK